MQLCQHKPGSGTEGDGSRGRGLHRGPRFHRRKGDMCIGVDAEQGSFGCKQHLICLLQYDRVSHQ